MARRSAPSDPRTVGTGCARATNAWCLSRSLNAGSESGPVLRSEVQNAGRILGRHIPHLDKPDRVECEASLLTY